MSSASTNVGTTPGSIRALLLSVVDYAGLFPPATLDMAQATRNYASYRAGRYSWMLGRFVVPIGRLVEFEVAAHDLLPRLAGAAPWRLSVLGSGRIAEDAETIRRFNERHARPEAGCACVIDTLELKAARAAEIEAAMYDVPTGLTAYFEIPLGSEMPELLKAIVQFRARAKVRAGGLTPDAIPRSAELARFLEACVTARASFKATAGLHHPVRRVNPLTYEPEGPRGLMHGFLNLLLAAALAGLDPDQATLAGLLDENAPRELNFGDDAARWRKHEISTGQIIRARERFVIAVGACSFEEPVEELTTLGLL